MATDLSLATQEAVFAKVDADVPLAALVANRIFDQPPNVVTFPYITMPPFDSVLNRFKDGMGQTHRVTFDIWSRPDQGGATEARNIIEALYDIFETGTASTGNRSGLTVTGGTVSRVQITDTRMIEENDRRTYHGIVTLEVRTRS